MRMGKNNRIVQMTVNLNHLYLIAFSLSACHQTADQASATGQTQSLPPVNLLLAPQAFADTLDALPNEQLIDVRTPAEYEAGHLPEAVMIDFRGDGFENKVAQLDKTRPVMLYCAGGGRSHEAAARLEKLGFQKVYELEGGMKNWVSRGEVVEK